MTTAMICLSLFTSSDQPGLKVRLTAFCPKLNSGGGRVEGSDSGISFVLIEKIIKK